MSNPYFLVREFHKVFEHPIGEQIAIPPEDRVKLRYKLIEEEYKELKEAVEQGDLEQIAKEWADLQYVVSGFAIEFGIPEYSVDAVHKSNLSKLGPNGEHLKRDDGKTLKGPNYQPPDMKAVLHAQKRSRELSSEINYE